MDANALVDYITQAAQSGDYLALAVGALALIVPVVLHAFGKNVPLVSTVLNALVAFVKSRKASPAPVAPAGESLSNVVKIEDGRKGPVE